MKGVFGGIGAKRLAEDDESVPARSTWFWPFWLELLNSGRNDDNGPELGPKAFVGGIPFQTLANLARFGQNGPKNNGTDKSANLWVEGSIMEISHMG